ncbi:TrbI/VirB10 family protein [Telmatobacter bradus]|uniref:TrbI/VirB10 family protein n=1 Tax=Telmatobacter bradus TaxID=474953 RepID=UPI003B42D731
MNNNENNESGIGLGIAQVNSEDSAEAPRPGPPLPMEPALVEDRTDAQPPTGHATRKGSNGKSGIEKSKLIMLGGGLLAAVLFLALTSLVNRSSTTNKATEKQPSHPAQQQAPSPSKGSVTPLMETVQTNAQENTSGQVHPGDIKRTSTPAPGAGDHSGYAVPAKPHAGSAAGANTLGAIPSFSDTQQKWEEPQPYGETGHASPVQVQQSQNALKEASLVFVRAPVPSQPMGTVTHASADTGPVLEMTPGSRIEAKLETQISSSVLAPVVAVVEHTYAIGDRVVVPAGAHVYGQLQQADRSGFVGVKFDEIELLDGQREKIEAIGAGLDLGPIKGTVYGKNTGKNFLIKAASGVGSLAAMLVGNNNSGAFSEGDLLRQRVAENVGNAGDSELMSMNATSRIIVSVPADTKIYIVFTKHEESQTGLHRVAGQ